MDSAILQKLERLEAMLVALVERQTVKSYYDVDEFARLVGKAPFTVREWARMARSFLKRPLQPIICRPDGEIGDGNRRQAGVLLEAGPDVEVPVCITDELMSAGIKLEIQMESAIHSRGLSAFEQFTGGSQW